MNYHLKKDEKINHLQDNITKLKEEIQQYEETTREYTKHLPVGQIVSKSFHKRLSSIDLKIGEKLEKIKYYQEKINTIKNNKTIYLGESDSIKRLRDKLEKLENEKSIFLELNKTIKSKRLSLEEKIEYLKKIDPKGQLLNESFFNSSSNEQEKRIQEFIIPPYMYGNGKIKHVKEQLEKALILEEMEGKEEEYNQRLLIINPSINRVQIEFKSIPEKEAREELKKNNFKFTKEGFWQNHLNNKNIEMARKILIK